MRFALPAPGSLRVLAALAALVILSECSGAVLAGEPQRQPVPNAMDFSGPRETWQRLSQALRRGDKAAAMNQLTPAARGRYEKSVDEWLNTKPFDENRFGKVRAVTLSGTRFATVSLTRIKEGATYSSDAMMMRGDDGRWRVDRLPPPS